MIAVDRGYKSNVWATFNQIKKQGCKLVDAKGQGVRVVSWAVITKNSKGEPLAKEDRFAVPRSYTVFNADLIEGDFKLPAKAETNNNDNDQIADCEQIVSSFENCPTIEHNSTGAFYSPTSDRVFMPNLENFDSSEEYYSALFHELAHSTGHESRLARKGVTDKNAFASHAYGQEELVAEFTSAFLCSATGIADRTIENSAAYLNNWKKAIKADQTIVLKAIQQAQKAADYIRGIEAPAYIKDASAA
jgi:antirestriction protein ArdC